MKPGSKVNTPCSLVRLDMSSDSGPMVPETAFSGVVFPVARFLSSYFVLMRFPDGWSALGSAALHGRTSESREHALGRARRRARTHLKIRAALGAETLQSAEPRLWQPQHISCGIYRRGRR